MLYKKKLLHIISKKNNTNIYILRLLFINILCLKGLYAIIISLSNYINTYNFMSLQNTCYNATYTFCLYTKTKHLFLFTIYMIYTKIWKFLHIFDFKFCVLKHKIKKITILRAPCYHKNSKEQYGFSIYKGKIKSTFLYNKYKYYNFYLLTFLLSNKIKFLSKYIYILQKNEKKFIK